jgi:hypothetical protein
VLPCVARQVLGLSGRLADLAPPQRQRLLHRLLSACGTTGSFPSARGHRGGNSGELCHAGHTHSSAPAAASRRGWPPSPWATTFAPPPVAWVNSQHTFFSEPGPWNAVLFVPAAAAYSYLASVVEAGWLLLLDG